MENRSFYREKPEPRKGMAVASLVLGIISIPTFGVALVGAVVGIILGSRAIKNANNYPNHYGGKGIAIGGIVTSSLSLLLVPFIGIISAIAIPNLIKSRQAANEASAIGSVRAIHIAQVTYQSTTGRGRYFAADLETLGREGLIDSLLAAGQKNGYVFKSTAINPPRMPSMFDTTAVPLEAGVFGTGNRSFGSNETYVIWMLEGVREIKGTPEDRNPRGALPIN